MDALGLIIRGGFKPMSRVVMGLSRVRHGLGKPEVFWKTQCILVITTGYHGFVSLSWEVCQGCARPEYPAQSFYFILFQRQQTKKILNRQPVGGMVDVQMFRRQVDTDSFT